VIAFGCFDALVVAANAFSTGYVAMVRYGFAAPTATPGGR